MTDAELLAQIGALDPCPKGTDVPPEAYGVTEASLLDAPSCPSGPVESTRPRWTAALVGGAVAAALVFAALTGFALLVRNASSEAILAGEHAARAALDSAEGWATVPAARQQVDDGIVAGSIDMSLHRHEHVVAFRIGDLSLAGDDALVDLGSCRTVAGATRLVCEIEPRSAGAVDDRRVTVWGVPHPDDVQVGDLERMSGLDALRRAASAADPDLFDRLCRSEFGSDAVERACFLVVFSAGSRTR